MKNTVTMIGTLPPLKGMSQYIKSLLAPLSEITPIYFIGFKSLYPNWLYPGGTLDNSQKTLQTSQVTIRNLLNYYNPLRWLWAGLSVQGKVVHAQWWSYVLAPTYLVVLFVAKYIRRKKIIITVHNVIPHEEGGVKYWLHISVYFLADHFIVHTEEMRDQMIALRQSYNKKISVIPFGLFTVPQTDMTVEEARTRLKIPPHVRTVLFFGTIRPYKGLEDLLQAVAELRDDKIDVWLVIAGAAWNSWKQYDKLINQLRLQHSVIACPNFIPENEIEIFFKAADIVVLPYRKFQAQSGAASLAQFFKKPMVVADLSGLREFVPGADQTFQPGNVKQLAQRISAVLEKESFIITGHNTWEDVAQRTLAVYKKV